MITFVSYASVDPVVISEELINNAINEQVEPEIAEIAKKEGIDPEEVKAIRLDYKSNYIIQFIYIYIYIYLLMFT